MGTLRHGRWLATLAMAGGALFQGCLDETSDRRDAADAAPDATWPDAYIPRDTGARDAEPDAVTPLDAAVPHDAAPDAAFADAALDMAVPDAALDMAVPDMAVADMAVPDMTVPDMAVPDMAVPDAGCLPVDETCDGVDEDCDGATDEGFGVGEPCEGVGACGEGVWECDGAGGVRCSSDPGGSASQARAEVCNGLDDDCDGATDEDPGALAAVCYDGPPASVGRGVCQSGVAACVDGEPGECVGQVVPSPDVCNALDDDCDGGTDEGYVVVRECGQGVCRLGARPSRCDRGVERPCEPGQPTGDDTDCDGADDDCDGATDEAWQSVGCGVGRCALQATPSTCVGGVETPCRPGPAAVRDFTCDGSDDDCDGLTDEDYAPVAECGVGVCRRATPSRCEDGVETPCTPGPATGDDTDCDGEDDDCDGRVDEGYVPVADCGVGACRAAARPSRCVAGVETVCQPGPAAASDDTCDATDDDCDGDTDEDYVVVARCGQGVCATTSTPSSCVAGVETQCRSGAPAGADATCNDLDDDCDGDTDEGVAVLADGELRVTATQTDARRPALVAAGANAWGLAWADTRNARSQIFTRRPGADGRPVGQETVVSTNNGNHFNPSLAWTGNGYGVAWHSTRDGSPRIYFAKLDAAGARVGEERPINVTFAASSSSLPALVWNGNGFGLAWQDDRDGVAEIWFARLDADGARQGDEVQVTDTNLPSTVPALAWNGNGYGVSWAENRDGNVDVLFARLGADGRIVGDVVGVAEQATTSTAPDVVWNGNGYALAWQDTRDGNAEIYVARLSAGGQRVGDDMRVTDDPRPSLDPSLVWNGAGYGVSWYDRRDGNDEIYFAHLSAAGANTSGDLRISNAAGTSQLPSLAWNGGEYAVSWYDGRHGPQQIYVGRGALGCP